MIDVPTCCGDKLILRCDHSEQCILNSREPSWRACHSGSCKAREGVKAQKRGFGKFPTGFTFMFEKASHQKFNFTREEQYHQCYGSAEQNTKTLKA